MKSKSTNIVDILSFATTQRNRTEKVIVPLNPMNIAQNNNPKFKAFLKLSLYVDINIKIHHLNFIFGLTTVF